MVTDKARSIHSGRMGGFLGGFLALVYQFLNSNGRVVPSMVVLYCVFYSLPSWVLDGWLLELFSFAPDIRVNVYHTYLLVSPGFKAVILDSRFSLSSPAINYYCHPYPT